MKVKPQISYLIIMGDSLSDRGTMYNRRLFSFIRMSVQSGLEGKSPSDSFTNGLPWSDQLIAILLNDFTIETLEKEKYLDTAVISDAIITRDSKIYNAVHNIFSLGNDLAVTYNGDTFARTYIEGGLTADNYNLNSKKKFCFSVSKAITREILSTLEKKRELLLNDDKKNNLSPEKKAQTLAIEWSGANDLITVNKAPNEEDADYAINARIKNVEELIKNGYQNFVLINLPDLSLTPRYQNQSDTERNNAKNISNKFNDKLKSACEKLRKENPNCTIELFDVNEIFLNIYKDPKKYNFDVEKLKQPYTQSKDFKLNPNHTSPAKGYMFWDDVHPTADLHAIIAYLFYDKYKRLFKITAPKNEMPNQSVKRHFLDKDRHATSHDVQKAKDDFEIKLRNKY